MNIIKKLRSLFENYFRNVRIFKKNSIFYYYCKLFLVVFLVPFFIFNTVMASFYYKNLNLRSEMSARQSFMTVENNLVNIMDETTRAYMTIIQRTGASMFFQIKSLDDMYFQINELKDLDKLIDDFAEISNTINSITVYSKSCGYVLSLGTNNYIENFSQEPWYNKLRSDRDNFFLPGKDGKNFYICYNVFFKNKVQGVLIFDISGDMLLPPDLGNISARFCDNGKNVFFSHGDMDERYISYPEENSSQSRKNIFYLASNPNGIYINLAIPTGETYTVEMGMYIVLWLIITIVISLVLALIVSIKSYSSIDQILLEIDGYGTEGFSDSETFNEISFITSSISGIHKKNILLQEELTTSAFALKQMQIETLQMQFNPHFLFNALNSLSMKLTRDHGMDSPYPSLIVLLSDILCESLNTNKYLVHICDEIAYAKKYLDFQKLTDTYLFDTVWSVDESLLGCYTVKLSMQPLIENAIKHGVKSLRNETKGTIEIDIRREGDTAIFTVSNTCSRIDEDTVRKIQESMKNGDMPSSKNIGLKNVNKRLRLIFGDNYGCTVSAKDNIFTVEMKIPVIENL